MYAMFLLGTRMFFKRLRLNGLRLDCHVWGNWLYFKDFVLFVCLALVSLF